MTIFEQMSIIGLFVGPIVGALITLWLQNRGLERERRLNIFRALMRNRRTWVDADHVAALNLIEVEFHKSPKIVEAYRAFFQSLNVPYPKMPAEELYQGIDEQESIKRINAYNDRTYIIKKNLHTKLVALIAKNLGYKIEQIDILEGGYLPQAFTDLETEQNAIRRFFVELYLGRRSIPVTITETFDSEHETRPENPFRKQ